MFSGDIKWEYWQDSSEWFTASKKAKHFHMCLELFAIRVKSICRWNNFRCTVPKRICQIVVVFPSKVLAKYYAQDRNFQEPDWIDEESASRDLVKLQSGLWHCAKDRSSHRRWETPVQENTCARDSFKLVFPPNFTKSLRTRFLQNTLERQFLERLCKELLVHDSRNLEAYPIYSVVTNIKQVFGNITWFPHRY